MYDAIISNGLIVQPEGIINATICIKDGKIDSIKQTSTLPEGVYHIDASGKYIFPGIVDAHVHIGEPDGSDENEYISCYSKAALHGGVTTGIDMPLNLPSVYTKKHLDNKLQRSIPYFYHDMAMWGAFVPNNIPEFEDLYHAGVCGFKGFMAPAGWDDYQSVFAHDIRKALLEVKKFNGIVGLHCEDYSIINGLHKELITSKCNDRHSVLASRPLSAELIAVQTAIALSKETGGHVHICHVSHPEVAELIKNAQAQNIPVTGETCVHYLVFSEEDYLEKGPLFQCAPPLRNKNARNQLWNYVLDGTLSCLVSDHSAWIPELKDDIHNPCYTTGCGITGSQNMFQVFYHEAVGCKHYSPSLLAKVFSENPAKLFGLWGKKGAIKEGFDADLFLFDPNKSFHVESSSLLYRHPISAYLDYVGNGCVTDVFLRGKHLIKQGSLVSQTPYGIYQPRN